MNNIKNIGDKCITCFSDTSFGSGKFVNRIPAEDDKHEGYMCPDCQMIECDDCNESILDYVSTVEGSFVCDDCFKKGGYKEL